MRCELKRPLGTLFPGEPRQAISLLMEALDRRRPALFASVGDFISGSAIEHGLDPEIVVVDNRVMRAAVEPLDLRGRRLLRARNPPGSVTAEAWRALDEAVTLKRAAVVVEGEEDLMVLPLIALMPLGSAVAYGQPGEGVVLVEVTEESKAWAEGFLRRMEAG